MRWRTAFAAAAVAAVAAQPAAQTSGTAWSDTAVTRLAIDLAAAGPIAPIQMVANGRPLIGVYDRFRLAAVAARAAFVAGHPMDSAAPPAELSSARTIVVAYSGSFLPDGVPAQSIDVTSKDGRVVKRIAFLKAAEISVALPGETLAGDALVASFDAPTLRPGDRIKLQSASTSLRLGPGMPGVVAGPSDIVVNFTVPKERSTPAATMPAGVNIPPSDRNVKIEGVLDLTGHVRYAHVIDGPESLRAAALDAVSKWVYEPAMMWKSPVPLVMQAIVPFR